MADQGYVAQFTARVALDKKEIAQQVLSQFQNMQAQADKNQIVYKFTADTSELEKILADIQKKDIKIGTDIVLTTSERDLQNQINQIQNMLKQKARGITSTLQTTIADVFSQNPISIKDMIVAEGIGKTATEKNVKKLAENIRRYQSGLQPVFNQSKCVDAFAVCCCIVTGFWILYFQTLDWKYHLRNNDAVFAAEKQIKFQF